jgi:hypothetical protein
VRSLVAVVRPVHASRSTRACAVAAHASRASRGAATASVSTTVHLRAAPVLARRVRGMRTMASATSAENPKVATKGDFVKGTKRSGIIDVRGGSLRPPRRRRQHTRMLMGGMQPLLGFLGCFPSPFPSSSLRDDSWLRVLLACWVAVHFVGKLLSDGSVFESTEGKSPLQFKLGEGQVSERPLRKAKAVQAVQAVQAVPPPRTEPCTLWELHCHSEGGPAALCR